MQISQMWRQFSLAGLRDLPGLPEVRFHYKRDRARWLHLNQTFRGSTEVDKPKQFQTLPLETTSESMDMLAIPTGCRNCMKKHPFNTPGPCRLPERCWRRGCSLRESSSSSGSLLLLSVVLALGCLLMKASYCSGFHVQKIMWASLPDSFQAQFMVALQTLYQPWPACPTCGLSQFPLSVKPFS